MHIRTAAATMTLGVLAPLGLALPANAATTQSYCNDSASEYFIEVGDVYVSAGACYKASSAAIVYVDGRSYKVKYDSGSFSECRETGGGFDAYNKPSKLTFRVWNNYDCKAAH